MVIPTIVMWFLCGLVSLRIILSAKSLLYLLGTWWTWLEEQTQAYQFYKIPRYNESSQENPLSRKASVYISSLIHFIETSDHAHLFSSGRKPNDFFLHLDPHHSLPDSFLTSPLSWSHHPTSSSSAAHLLLRLRRQDRRRILRPYLHHIESVADDIELRRRDIKLFTAACSDGGWGWRGVLFTHPCTLETIVMDPDLKNRVRSDLEGFLKGKAYYHRLGRVWRRSYLLYGPPGTGKSSFVAAMARFLCYDLYDLDLSRVADCGNLRSLLLRTTRRAVIVVEDLDRYIAGGEGVAGMLGLMDGIFSGCCGDERVMVFTMTGGKEVVDPAVLRPGRLDVHIYFPMCDFSAFKMLASSYLGLKDHKLYPQVEESLQSAGGGGGARLSPAEIGEIMIANRGTPSRAIRLVISALQRSSAASIGSGEGRIGRWSRAEDTGTEEEGGDDGGGGLVFGKEGKFRKLYGLVKMMNGCHKDGEVPSVEKIAAAAAVAKDS